MPSSPRHIPPAAYALLLGLALLLTGCVTTAGGPPAQLQRALQQAGSAAFTVQTSFTQLLDGRTLPTVTETTCQDMLKEAQNAQSSASALSVDTTAQHKTRTEVVNLINTTATLIVSVQDYLAHKSGSDAHQLITSLSANRKKLASLHDSLASGG